MARYMLVAVMLCSGCASMTDRIVHDAMQGLVWEADYIPKDGGDPEALAALHRHLTEVLRVDVLFVPANDMEIQGAFGISWVAEDQRFIRVRQDLSIIGTIEVLGHEAAHLYQPPYLTRSQGDVFAEIVSAHVASRLGVPGAAHTSALWLKQHKPNLRVALDLKNEIAYVADILTPGSTTAMLERLK